MQPVDAQLGIEGKPQSATGQTSLWTGINGPRVMGRHQTGFPGPTLIRVIKEYSIVKKVRDSGRQATLLNAYREDYLKRLQKHPRLTSVSTHVQLASGQPLKMLDDLEKKEAIFMDITHEIMHRFFPELKERFPAESPHARGRDLAVMARKYDLALHEYFITDRAGHDQDFELAGKIIPLLEEFIRGVVEGLNAAEDLLLVTSDHGNLEDLSTKSHTENQVPAFAYGKNAEKLVRRVRSLIDIPAFIYELLDMDVDLDAFDYRGPVDLASFIKTD